MAAFDKSIKPKGVTPADTTETIIFTAGTDSPAGQDVQVLVNACPIGDVAVATSIGITPSGGSRFWIVFEESVSATNPIVGLGPWFLQPGDEIVGQIASAGNVTVSVTGSRSS